MTSSKTTQDFALAIRPIEPGAAAPVVYDLNGTATNIGSAEDNHIVLRGPGVEPYHVALRREDKDLVLVVDWALARREGIPFKAFRAGDRLYCQRHGKIPGKQGRCPKCIKGERAPVWLFRPVQAGDVFPIGQEFEASVLSQARPKKVKEEAPENAYISPWPDLAYLESLGRPAVQIGKAPAAIEDQSYPLDDSNYWVWSPPESPLPVFLHQRANHAMTRHAYRNADREVGGLMLGRVYHDPKDEIFYPVVTQTLPAKFATEARGHLTFTHDTWRELNRQRDDLYPGLQVVGWYHTHPGLDIFLSQMDLFIHRNFFRQPWQVALVIDPKQDLAGIFVWSGKDLLDPQKPHQLFRVADLADDVLEIPRSRIRIKLGERVK